MVPRAGAVAACAVLAIAALTSCSASRQAPSAELSDLFSTKDQQKKVADCLVDRGWDAQYNDEDGSIRTDITDEQEPLYRTDSEECSEEVGVNLDGELTAEQFTVVYDWYTEIAECLDDHGWDVPERPTLQAFQSTYESDPWIPWMNIGGEDLGQARTDCPVLNVPR